MALRIEREKWDAPVCVWGPDELYVIIRKNTTLHLDASAAYTLRAARAVTTQEGSPTTRACATVVLVHAGGGAETEICEGLRVHGWKKKKVEKKVAKEAEIELRWAPNAFNSFRMPWSGHTLPACSYVAHRMRTAGARGAREFYENALRQVAWSADAGVLAARVVTAYAGSAVYVHEPVDTFDALGGVASGGDCEDMAGECVRAWRDLRALALDGASDGLQRVARAAGEYTIAVAVVMTPRVARSAGGRHAVALMTHEKTGRVLLCEGTNAIDPAPMELPYSPSELCAADIHASLQLRPAVHWEDDEGYLYGFYGRVTTLLTERGETRVVVGDPPMLADVLSGTATLATRVVVRAPRAPEPAPWEPLPPLKPPGADDVRRAEEIVTDHKNRWFYIVEGDVRSYVRLHVPTMAVQTPTHRMAVTELRREFFAAPDHMWLVLGLP